MRLLPLLLVLAGCDGVFGLQRLRDKPDANLAADARPGCTLDRFSDGLQGVLTRWDRYSDAPGAQVTVESEQLVANVAANVGGSAWVQANATLDLTGATTSVDVTGIPAANSQTYFLWVLDTGNYYVLDVVGDQLLMGIAIEFAPVETASLDYDSVAHRFWRIEQNGVEVRFSTSADGKTWTQRHSVSVALPVETIVVELGATAGIDQLAVSVRFDDYELCR